MYEGAGCALYNLRGHRAQDVQGEWCPWSHAIPILVSISRWLPASLPSVPDSPCVLVLPSPLQDTGQQRPLSHPPLYFKTSEEQTE